MNKRICWIDNLRAIGICLVVLVHTGRISGLFLEDYIRSFFMPLFFFISGLLVKEEFYKAQFSSVLKKLGRKLIVPYIFFSAVSYLTGLFLFQYFKAQQFEPLKALLSIISGVPGAYNGALWFFTSLFTVQVYFYFLFKLRHRKILFSGAIVFLSILGYVCTTIYRLQFPWNLGLSLTGLVFYSVGYLFSCQLRNKKIWFHNWYVAVFSLPLYIYFTHINSDIKFYIGNYGNYLSFYVAAFSGISVFSYIAKLIPCNCLLSNIGRHTLVIFSTHLLVIPIITGFLVYVIGVNQSELESGFLIAFQYTIVTIYLTFYTSILMNKYLPQVLGKS